jgi:hypothetical protein
VLTDLLSTPGDLDLDNYSGDFPRKSSRSGKLVALGTSSSNGVCFGKILIKLFYIMIF